MIKITLAGAATWLLTPTEHKADYIDIDDALRKQVVREAEYQATADEQSRVLRISGRRRVAGPLKRLRAI